jgi:hypothetical protein
MMRTLWMSVRLGMAKLKIKNAKLKNETVCADAKNQFHQNGQDETRIHERVKEKMHAAGRIFRRRNGLR